MEHWIDALTREVTAGQLLEEFDYLDGSAISRLARTDPDGGLAGSFGFVESLALERAVTGCLESWCSNIPMLPEDIDRARAVLRAWLLSSDEEARQQIAVRLGELVVTLCWDGGAPGMSGHVYVRRAGGVFFQDIDGIVVGPHGTIEEALSDWAINRATLSVDSTRLATADLIRLMPLWDDLEPGFRVSLNGTEFEVRDVDDQLTLQAVEELSPE